MQTSKFDHDAAPLRISAVHLNVHDLERMVGFYERLLGLPVVAQDGQSATLRVGAYGLLHLHSPGGLKVRDTAGAGLFHTAFLLPDRDSLGQWLTHAAAQDVRLEGASDHLVSEALYLSDPEGNGIEVYADRAPASWHDDKGRLQMASARLDLNGLLRAATGTWSGFPENGCIGHVHLQVGDTQLADRFMQGILGLERTCVYPGAHFYATGGYHHHLAANTWNSRGADPRASGQAGLAQVDLHVADPALARTITARAHAAGLIDGTGAIRDPWMLPFALVA